MGGVARDEDSYSTREKIKKQRERNFLLDFTGIALFVQAKPEVVNPKLPKHP